MDDFNAAQRMGTDKPALLILRFALPSIFTMVISSIYNVVDKIFVGNGVGYLGLAATTASTWINMIISACYALVGTGAGISVAMATGKNDHNKARQIIQNAILLEIALGIIIAAVGSTFLDTICASTGAGGDAIPYVRDYLRVIFPGTVCACVGSGLLPVIRSLGYPRKAFVIAVCGSVTNCFLDPIFIFVFHTGIRGAAIATVLSQLLTAVLTLCFFFEHDSTLIKLPISSKVSAEILRLGFPGFLMTVIMAIMVVVFTNTLKYYGNAGSIGGDVAISSLGLSTSIGDVINMISIGMQQGIAPLIAYNYSIQRYERMRTILRISLLTLLAVLTAFWLILELFPEPLIGLFGEAGNLAFAVYTVRIYNLALPTMAFQTLGSMYLQSTGRVRSASLVGLTRNIFFGIPLLFILPLFWGVHGAIAMGPIADVGGAAVSMLVVYRSVKKTISPPNV